MREDWLTLAKDNSSDSKKHCLGFYYKDPVDSRQGQLWKLVNINNWSQNGDFYANGGREILKY